MTRPTNIYPVVVFELNGKIREFIEQLNNMGQIDVDDNGHPYLVSVNRVGNNNFCHIIRNGKMENFVMNTRKKKAPVCSWQDTDGYKRETPKKRTIVMDPTPTESNGRRPERKKRTYESFKQLVDDMLTS